MLSPADFEEKQIVVVFSDQVKALSLKNDNLLVTEEGSIKNQLPCSKILSIFVIGECTITTKIFQRILKYNTSITFLSRNLKRLGTFGRGLDGNFVLRERQYSENHQLLIAKKLVANKIANQLSLLKEVRNKDDIRRDAIERIENLQGQCQSVITADSLRGLEWSASKLFFQTYFKELKRYKRMPRTRMDVPNFMLDVGYSYLFNFVDTLLQIYGFDTYRGVYHTLFFQRKSLACDIMEPFRCIIDKQLRKCYNLGQIREKDFRFVQGEYQLDFQKRGWYTKLMMDAIIEQKSRIFLYIRQYYKSVMARMPGILPTFYIS